MTTSALLELTLSTTFLPATNLQSDAASSDWRFLLPHLSVERILFIGEPSIQALSVLSRTCKEIIVICDTLQQSDDIRDKCEDKGIQNTYFKQQDHMSVLPFSDSDFDLVRLSGRNYKFIYSEAVMSEIHRILKQDGVIYYEASSLNKYIFRRTAHKRLLKRFHFSTIGNYWLTPLSGELRTAAPLDNSKISVYFFRNVLFGQSLKTRSLSSLGKVLGQTGLLNYLSPRCGVMLRNDSKSAPPSKLPDYLIELAEQESLDISQFTFGFSARGRYNSNKVIFFLFDRKVATPAYVIKMTRTSEYNFRLKNEFRALSLLKKNRFLEPGTYPEPVFHGTHNNLAVLCIQAVQGLPFRSRTSATADCVIANRAMELILRLGTESADKGASSSNDVAAALRTLYKRFIETYSLSSEDQKFLSEKIDTLASQSEKFPLVFQHGDPGTWNMFVSESNNVILLDWESCEPKGMPLWDLFYFFRTYASWMSRKDGTRDSITSFKNHFLEQSALGDRLHDYTDRYCAKIGLNKTLVEPLFYTCWMHRALKESTRLQASNLNSGSFINLLRLVIEQNNSPGLTRLFLD